MPLTPSMTDELPYRTYAYTVQYTRIKEQPYPLVIDRALIAFAMLPVLPASSYRRCKQLLYPIHTYIYRNWLTL